MDDPLGRWRERVAEDARHAPAVERFLRTPQLAEPKPTAYDVPRRLARRKCRSCGRRGVITARGVAYGHAVSGVNCPGSYRTPAPRWRDAMPRTALSWLVVVLAMLAAAAVGRLALRIF